MNEKIDQLIALAPVVDLRQSDNQGLKKSAKLWKMLQKTTKWSGIYYVEFPFQKQKFKTICRLTGQCDNFNKEFNHYSKYTVHKWQTILN